jgi:stage V sporulation protein D (sporulation-specific penicillin-binding protein)
MAAPTVGAVMADILPYLGVKHSYTEEDAAGRTVILPDFTGLTEKEAQAKLKELGLTAEKIGTEESVTAQLPDAGQGVPGDSQVILYYGEEPDTEEIAVPDFIGMTRQQASDEAGKLGLYILVTGNDEYSPNVTVTVQAIPKDTLVKRGTTIQLEFADTKAAD